MCRTKYNRLLVIFFGAAVGAAMGITMVSCGKTKDNSSLSSNDSTSSLTSEII